MTSFFHAMPLWQATLAVLAIALAVGLGSSVGVRKLFRLKATKDETEVAINLMQVSSAYIGIMLAFAGVLVWQDYENARAAVHEEASAASEMYRDLSIYGEEAAPARRALKLYVSSIITDEWELLPEGRGADATEERLEELFREVGRLNPKDDRQGAIYSEAFSKLNQLVALRRDRITASQTEIPQVLWIVGLLGSILTIAYASAFTNSRYSLLMVSGVSLTIGLVFLFLVSVDNPFKGPSGLDGHQFRELSSIFERIDRFH